MGLLVIAAEIVNTNLFGIYLRFLKKREEKKLGHIMRMKIVMVQINTYIEWSLRVILIGITGF